MLFPSVHCYRAKSCTLLAESRKTKKYQSVREGTFLIAGGGCAGDSEGSVISKYFTNYGGSNLFYTQPGEGRSIFCKEKITPCRLVDSYLLTKTRSA